jgi:hypothetical protein
MAAPSPQDVTLLLKAWNNGEQAALEQLMPLVYNELHRLAHRFMGRERSAHTLQSTALVHEAYGRLIDLKSVSWQNRAHCFAVSAQLMRRILVDYARSPSFKAQHAPGKPLYRGFAIIVFDHGEGSRKSFAHYVIYAPIIQLVEQIERLDHQIEAHVVR